MQGQMHLVEKLNYKIIKKLLGVMLKKDSNRLIKYNYPKLVVTQEYKLLESNQTRKI